jgi:hypothetical protein
MLSEKQSFREKRWKLPHFSDASGTIFQNIGQRLGNAKRV